MLVSKASKIRADKGKFNAAKQGVHVAKITGNANKAQRLATQLKWESLHEENNDGESPKPTVVVIALDTIYHDHCVQMHDKYQQFAK